MKFNNICCIGGGISGRVMCIAIAFKCPGIRVSVLDDEKTISDMNSESFSFYGTDIKQILKKCLHRNLFFSSFYESAIKEADMIFLSVKVPTKKFTERKHVVMDFKELEEATKLIALYSESDKIIVEESDVSVKAIEKISWILKSNFKTAFQFSILSLPSFITEKSTLEEILNPERIIIGSQCNPTGRSAAHSLQEIFEEWLPSKRVLIISHFSAGLYKLILNAFIAEEQCSINAVTAMCEESGADLSVVLNVLGKELEIGEKHLKPTIEIEDFEEDILNMILKCEMLKLSDTADYWRTVLEMNESFKKRFFERIKTVLGPVKGQDIVIWGFSRSDPKKRKPLSMLICEWLMRETSSFKICDSDLEDHEILKELKLENVDEKDRKVQIYSDKYLAIHHSSGLIVCKKKEDFTKVDYSKLQKWMKRPLLIDCFRFFDPEILKMNGIQYFTLGSTIGKNMPPWLSK